MPFNIIYFMVLGVKSASFAKNTDSNSESMWRYKYRSEMNSKMLYFIRELTQANHCCLIHVVWTNTGLFSTKGRREEVSFGSYRKRSLITWMMIVTSLIVAIELEMIRTLFLLLFDIYIITIREGNQFWWKNDGILFSATQSKLSAV